MGRGRRRCKPAAPLLGIAVALIAAAVVCLPARLAAAGPAPARLVLDAGDAGGFIPGRPVPVRVEVDSDVLVAGQLAVSIGSSLVSQAVEVPGGSAKRFELVSATPAGQTQLTVQVTLTARGSQLATATVALNALPDTELVGVLPGLLAGQPVPGPAPLSVDAGTARFVAVTEQDLSLAPASLGPLSALAVGSDDLGRMSPGIRQEVLAWTTAGGRLMIDAKPADTVVGLPSKWKPTAGTRAPAGLGEVVLTSGAMVAGQWAGLVDPIGHGGLLGSNPGNAAPLSFSLASAAGLNRPRLQWLLAFLAVYIAVVGPVSFIVLRRQRRAELLWVVIPVVALLFAGSSYAVGSSERSGLRVTHGSVVDTTAGGGTTVSYVGISSPGEATARVHAPPGWVLSRYEDPNTNGAPLGQLSLDSAVVDSGVAGQLRLAAGQFAIVQASGPARFSGALELTAQSAKDGNASGTVINGTPFTLHDVSILIGGAGTDVNTLAPGAKATWQITSEPATGFGPDLEQQLWGSAASAQTFFKGGPGPVGVPVGSNDTGSPANLSTWGSAPDGLAPGTRGTGVAVAVGWTDQFDPPVTIEGRGPPTKGGTAIVGTAPVEAGGSVGDFAVERRVVRGSLSQIGPGMFANTNSADPLVVAWTLPRAAAGNKFSLSVPSGVGDVSVWSGRSWQLVAKGATSGQGPGVAPLAPAPTDVTGAPVPLSPPPTAVPFGQPPNGPPTVITLTSDDLVNGVVYARIVMPSFGQPVDMNALSLKVQP